MECSTATWMIKFQTCTRTCCNTGKSEDLPLRDQASNSTNICSAYFCGRPISHDPSHPSVATPIPHPYALAPSPPRLIVPVKLPPTHHIRFFLYGPRPVSHMTPPGTLHSRPARPRSRPLRTRPGHQHSAERCSPPAVQLPHQSEWPGAPSACGHGTQALRAP